MSDQQDRLLSAIAREEANRPDTDAIPLSHWEHDHGERVTCYWDGCDLSGVGVYSDGELIEVKDIEITGRA